MSLVYGVAGGHDDSSFSGCRTRRLITEPHVHQRKQQHQAEGPRELCFGCHSKLSPVDRLYRRWIFRLNGPLISPRVMS